jgi:hypothetical protein
VNHEGRAWIYKASRLRKKPVVTHSVGGGVVKVRGWGFTMDAPVTVHYHGRRVADARADGHGSIRLSFRVPANAQPPWYVVLTDSEGNYASFAGLSMPRQQVGGRGGPLQGCWGRRRRPTAAAICRGSTGWTGTARRVLEQGPGDPRRMIRRQGGSRCGTTSPLRSGGGAGGAWRALGIRGWAGRSDVRWCLDLV